METKKYIHSRQMVYTALTNDFWKAKPRVCTTVAATGAARAATARRRTLRAAEDDSMMPMADWLDWLMGRSGWILMVQSKFFQGVKTNRSSSAAQCSKIKDPIDNSSYAIVEKEEGDSKE